MSYNFLRGDRDQPYLLPPTCATGCPPTTSPGSWRTWSTSSTWRPSTEPPQRRARPPAYDPKTLLGVLLDAYAIGVRSSRQIQRRLREDVAFRVLAGNQPRPRDHRALPGPPPAGPGRVPGAVLAAVRGRRDGPGRDRGAGRHQAGRQRRRAGQPHLDKLEGEVAEILRQAAEADQREDEQGGPAHGDALPEAVANVTDPDSRLVHTRKGSLQGYNAQAVTTMEQLIVAAELTQQANDLHQLGPVLTATAATLGSAGITERPGTLLADAGYWTIANLTEIERAPELLIPPARHGRQGKPRKDGKPSASKSDGLRAAMTAKLTSEDGKGSPLGDFARLSGRG